MISVSTVRLFDEGDKVRPKPGEENALPVRAQQDFSKYKYAVINNIEAPLGEDRGWFVGFYFPDDDNEEFSCFFQDRFRLYQDTKDAKPILDADLRQLLFKGGSK